MIDTAFLKDLESSFPGGSDSGWYIYAGLVFQANDRMEYIGELFEYLHGERKSEADLARKSRALREAQLKASVLIGFPKAR